MANAPITCTVHTVVSPCALCHSETQILAALAYAFAVLNNGGTTGVTAETMMADGKCMACLSDKEMLAAALKIVGQYAVSAGYIASIDDILENASCLTCSNPKAIKSVIIKELCDYFAALSLPN